MRRIIGVVFFIGVFITSISAQGRCCHSDRDLPEFNRIRLKSLGHVYVKLGDVQKVRVEADDDVIDKVTTEVFGNELVISIEDGFPEWIQDPRIEIYIVVKDLDGLELSGVGKISSEGIIKTSDLELRNGGLGNIFLEIEADDVITELSGLGQISLEGKAKTNDIRIGGAGKVDSKYLETKWTKIHSSGIGSCTVHATENLDVKITGLGKVRYKGNPELTRKITGIGSLERL
jgi:putative autotransporter adhesin-like protein